MTKSSLIADSRSILLNAFHPKVLNEFRKFLKNQDIVVLSITEDAIKEFTEKMLVKFSRYLEGEK